MVSIRKILSLSLCLVFLLFSCKKEDDGTSDSCNNDFDQKAMFTNLADNLIIPAYQAFQTDFEKLQASAEGFVDAPDESALSQLQADFETAYLSWQTVAPFEFGPAETYLLRSSLNSFPVDEARVDQNIASGTYDFDQIETYDDGFPALDYLLFGIGADAASIVDKYTADGLAGNYRTYLTDVLTDMKVRLDNTISDWDSYRSSFIENTGTAAGTSLSLVINNLNEHYETIKRDKIGIPSGILTLGFTNPMEVEALYSGISLELAEAALMASQSFYLGNSLNGDTGLGLDDLLEHVKAEKNGESLDQIIRMQFADALAAVRAIPGPLSEAVDNEKEAVENAYNETTVQVVNLKTDMPSVLCVAITYVDNPSDSD